MSILQVNGVFPFAAHMVGAPALQMPGGGGDPYVGIGSNFNGPAAIGGMSRGGAHPPITEVVHMWVPNNMVGALIGTKVIHIIIGPCCHTNIVGCAHS